MTVVLRRPNVSRKRGHWQHKDYDVFDGERDVGRICLVDSYGVRKSGSGACRSRSPDARAMGARTRSRQPRRPARQNTSAGSARLTPRSSRCTVIYRTRGRFFFAICERSIFVKLRARVDAPAVPLRVRPDFGFRSSERSQVASLATTMAASMTSAKKMRSAGRFCACGHIRAPARTGSCRSSGGSRR
jgi:hypothetical protein